MRSLINLITLILVVAATIFFVRNPMAQLRALADSMSGPLGSFGEFVSGAGAPSLPLPGAGDGSAVRNVIQKIITDVPSVHTLSETIDLGGTPAGQPSSLAVGPLSAAGIIAASNMERSKSSLKPLAESAQLDASAQAKANDMLARQYFEHESPDGRSVDDLAADQKYAYLKIGENLALGLFENDAALVSEWMASPGHRANIMDGGYAEIGIGIAHGIYQGRSAYLVVQHFGTSRSACPAVDGSLKAQVEAGQATLMNIEESLARLKNEIDRGTAAGSVVNGLIDIYNQGIDSYEAKYSSVENIRATYNAQVVSFNACVQSVR